MNVHIDMDQPVQSEPRLRLVLAENLLRDINDVIQRMEVSTYPPQIPQQRNSAFLSNSSVAFLCRFQGRPTDSSSQTETTDAAAAAAPPPPSSSSTTSTPSPSAQPMDTSPPPTTPPPPPSSSAQSEGPTPQPGPKWDKIWLVNSDFYKGQTVHLFLCMSLSWCVILISLPFFPLSVIPARLNWQRCCLSCGGLRRDCNHSSRELTPSSRRPPLQNITTIQ